MWRRSWLACLVLGCTASVDVGSQFEELQVHQLGSPELQQQFCDELVDVMVHGINSCLPPERVVDEFVERDIRQWRERCERGWPVPEAGTGCGDMTVSEALARYRSEEQWACGLVTSEERAEVWDERYTIGCPNWPESI